MSGYIGQEVSRVEGPAKVTGSARYSGEIPLPGLAYAQIVGAEVASGRITSIDTSAAEHAPGVAGILTHRNTPPVNPVPLAPSLLGGPAPGETFYPMQDDVIHYAGQPVAVVGHSSTSGAVGDAGRHHHRPGPRRRLRAGEDLRRPGPRDRPARERRGRARVRGAARRRDVPVRRQPPQPTRSADHHGGLGRRPADAV